MLWLIIWWVGVATGAEMNRIKRNYQESQTRRSSHLRNLGDELHGVQKVMFENIDAALQRGELISGEYVYNHVSSIEKFTVLY